MIYTWICPFCSNKGSTEQNKVARDQMVKHLKAEHLESASSFLLPLVDKEKLIEEFGSRAFSHWIFEGANV
jgi:hypothetical protein